MSLFNDAALANMTPAQKVIEHVQLADAALEKAAALESHYTKQANAAKDLIPRVVTELVNAKCIPADKQEKLAASLQTHAGALEMVIKVADFLSRKAAAAEPTSSLGKAVEKTAAVNDREAKAAEADARFLAALRGSN